MINTICLNKNFSTTKLLIEEKPILGNRPEDEFETVLFLPKDENRKGEGGLRTKGYFKKSYDEKPLVTIITVVFNGESYLEETIQSVLQQSYDNVEYIIIDGGSTDGTIDIIKKYEDQIDYWVSEKDRGIYDAMNKGLTLAVGKFIGIINADDWYEVSAIELSINALQENNADYSIGNCRKVPSNVYVQPIYPLIKGTVYQEMMYPHISAFIKYDVYKSIGLFDTIYKIVADYDMALKIHQNNYNVVYVNETIATIIEGGVSSDTQAIKERFDTVIKHKKNVVSAYCKYSADTFKFYLKKILPISLIHKFRKFKKSRYQYESKD
ncbi:MAG: glycosyltransferase family 2 protein [Bacteroidota bacterium]